MFHVSVLFNRLVVHTSLTDISFQDTEYSWMLDSSLIVCKKQLIKTEFSPNQCGLYLDSTLYNNIARSKYPIALLEKLNLKALRTFHSQEVSNVYNKIYLIVKFTYLM